MSENWICVWRSTVANYKPLASWMGPAPTSQWMITWCMWDKTAATASWAGVNFDSFLGRTQVSRWFTVIMVSIARANKQLHHRTGVLAQAYAHFLHLLWHALNRCLQHQCMCRYTRCTGVFDISLHIRKNTLRRVCTYARVCEVCSVVLGDEGGGVQNPPTLVPQQFTCCWRGTDVVFWHEERYSICLYFLYCLTGVGVYVGVCVYT